MGHTVGVGAGPSLGIDLEQDIAAPARSLQNVPGTRHEGLAAAALLRSAATGRAARARSTPLATPVPPAAAVVVEASCPR